MRRLRPLTRMKVQEDDFFLTFPVEPITADRFLNFDFLPKLGWRASVFPATVSPILFAVVASSFALILKETAGFPGIDATAHTVLGVLVSFLSVFRTQQAYSRYWEARGHLGLLMAGLVDLSSMVSVRLGGSTNTLARRELDRLVGLYMSETVRFLRGASANTKRVSNFWLPEDAIMEAPETRCGTRLTDEECAILEAHPRSPSVVLKWIRDHLFSPTVMEGLSQNGKVSSNLLQSRLLAYESSVDRVLSQLQASWNGCAKIATTPMPQPYTQMSRWLIFFFVYSVPLVFVKSFSALDLADSGPAITMVSADMLLAFGYYGLDYCSNQLQNPFIAEFGDTQLDGRFLKAVCEDVSLLLLGPNVANGVQLNKNSPEFPDDLTER